MREYFTLHRSVFPSYLTIESGRMAFLCSVSSYILSWCGSGESHMTACRPYLYFVLHSWAELEVVSRKSWIVTISTTTTTTTKAIPDWMKSIHLCWNGAVGCSLSIPVEKEGACHVYKSQFTDALYCWICRLLIPDNAVMHIGTAQHSIMKRASAWALHCSSNGYHSLPY